MSTDRRRSKRCLPFPFNLLLVLVTLVALLIVGVRSYFEHVESQLLAAQDSAAIRNVLGTPQHIYSRAGEVRDSFPGWTFRRLRDGKDGFRDDDLPEVDGQVHFYGMSLCPPRGSYLVYVVDGEIIQVYSAGT